MKIDFKKHLFDNHDLLAHIVLNGLAETVKKDKGVIVTEEYKKNNTLDITLTVNGVEIDVEAFCDMWQKQVDDRREKIIHDYIVEEMTGKFSDIQDLMRDLGDRLTSEIEKRLEDWEKIGE